MSTPSLASFYEEPEHLGNLFAARGPYYGPLGHRGVDYNGHPSGTPIPSPVAGVVALVVTYKTLGHGVVIDTGGEYVGFWHLERPSSLKVGQRVAVGESVGALGSTGTASSGPHVHITREPSLSVGTARARDPLPLIRAALEASPDRKVPSMSTLYYCTKTDKPSTEESRQPVASWALGGESPGTSANWLETKSQAVATGWSKGHGPAVFLTRASFDSFAARHREPLRVVGIEGGTAGALPAEIADAVADTLADRLAE